MHTTAAAAYRAYKHGELTDEQYYVWLAMHDAAAETNWRRLMWYAAGRGRLTVPDIARLEKTKGGTQDDDHTRHDQG